MSSSSLLLTSSAVRKLVCLGATFSSATTNPWQVLASPRARENDLELFIATELVESRASNSSSNSDPHARGPSGREADAARSCSVGATSDLPLLPLPPPPRPPPVRSHIIRKPRQARPTRSSPLLRPSLHGATPTLPPPPPRHARALSSFCPTPPLCSPSVLSNAGGSVASAPPPFHGADAAFVARGVQTNGGQADTDAGITDQVKKGADEGGSDKDKARQDSAHLHSAPYVDELNTLLRHPALYNPILAPRFPIVLCHGLYGFDVRGPAFFRLHYWADLLKILRGKVGAEVFVTAVPGTGGIKHRAHVLHNALEEMDGIKGRDLNFLTHSMGGLDARYLLSNIRPTSYNPRSLTTISTPHRGSEFMSWCRVNIGVGTFDADSHYKAARLHEDASIPLPFSLKSPILSRAQVDAARVSAAASKLAQDRRDLAKAVSSAGLPSSFTASISGYLLDLIDSPAYANLTPSFLHDVFNPRTPDRPDIRYFSVAARTDKISIWHPLWLPKMVLDGAEAARAAKGILPDENSRGNDGLVTVESAKWGEFLGVLEGADHWEVRGSSGLVDALSSAKVVAEATNIASKEKPDEAGQAAKAKPSWKWQDVYALVGIKSSESSSSTKAEPTPPPAPKPPSDRSTEEESSLAAIASWIFHSLPGVPNSPAPTPSTPSSSSPSSPSPSPEPTPHAPLNQDPAPLAGSQNPGLEKSSQLGPGAQSARMLYGAPKAKPQPKFSLERTALALCRKLHNEGL